VADVVALANRLSKLFQTPQSSTASLASEVPPTPSDAEIAAALKAYRDDRINQVKAATTASSGATARSTWGSFVLWLMDRFVLKDFVMKFLINSKKTRASIARIPVFDYVYGTEAFSGTVKWDKPMPTKAIKA
jgi:hypothetical protein